MTDRFPSQPASPTRVPAPPPGFVLDPPPAPRGFVPDKRPPQIVEFEGQRYEFPGDATDAEIEEALGREAPARSPTFTPADRKPSSAGVHGLKPVTDPALLRQLNAPDGMKPVTDPALLRQLDGPPIEIEAPDGTIVEFPPGTTDAEIIEIMRREYGGPSAQLPSSTGLPGGLGPRAGREGEAPLAAGTPRLKSSPSTFGMFDQVDELEPQGPAVGPLVNPGATPTKALDAGSQGAWRSIADTAGLIPDIVNMGANAALAATDFASQKLGGPAVSFRFPMASDAIANQASKAAPALGIPVQDPAAMSEKERLAYNVARFGGQAALTAGVATPLAAARGAVRSIKRRKSATPS